MYLQINLNLYICLLVLAVQRGLKILIKFFIYFLQVFCLNFLITNWMGEIQNTYSETVLKLSILSITVPPVGGSLQIKFSICQLQKQSLSQRARDNLNSCKNRFLQS